jgi:phosphohistidine phosphatase
METRRLSLLRHGKAGPAGGTMADRDRPLAERGRRDADAIGGVLATSPPDLVLCSPARRTRETLSAVLPHLKPAPRVELVEALYSGGDGTCIQAIAESGGRSVHVLVIGHNPTIHATAITLARHGDAALRSTLAGHFPTSALAIVEFELADWSGLRPGAGTLTALITPATLTRKVKDR